MSSITNFSAIAVNDQLVEQKENHPLDQIAKMLIMASMANQWSSQITAKAIKGLAGYVCGNHDIKAAIAILDKLPVADAKKVARRLEIALGNFQGIYRNQQGKVVITEGAMPILVYDRKSGWVCQYEGLLSPDKKIRNYHYDLLCSNRARLPIDWQQNLKLEQLQVQSEADKQIERVEKMVKSIRNCRSKWINDANAWKLRRLLELLDDEILSSEDAKVFSTTSNFHGGRK